MRRLLFVWLLIVAGLVLAPAYTMMHKARATTVHLFVRG